MTTPERDKAVFPNLLSFDPGAIRMGWACLTSKPESLIYVDSGIEEIPRSDNEPFQVYKLRLIEFWAYHTNYLITKYKPYGIVSEMVPAIGFERSVQNQLAKAAITSVQTISCFLDVPVYQIGATTVKKRIGGDGKASKVKVRNGVIEILPELRPRLKDWTKIFDESDAIAIGLAYLSHDNS